MSKSRVAIISGGPSSEHLVSLLSGEMVFKHLPPRYSGMPVIISRNGQWKFGKATPVSMVDALKKLRAFDIAFIALHGSFGEDGTIQALLESVGVPYTGSGPAASALAMNKHLSNLVFQVGGLWLKKP